MRIALIGHACGPNLGSEPGNTWNLAQNLSALHDIWVLTHRQHQETIDAYVAEHPNPRLRFVYVSINPKSDPWDPKAGEKGLRLHYLMWQKEAAKEATRLCGEEAVQLVHHFSLGTIKAPPHLQDMTVPVVWGPMGGGQTMPFAFRKYFRKQLPEELARIALASVLPLVPHVRKMARRAKIVLGNNQETIDLLKRAGAWHAAYALETALPEAALEPQISRHSERRVTLLWAGRVETRKALPLALEAIALTRSNARLLIAGDGPDRLACEAMKHRLSLGDRAKFLGRLSFDQMANQFREADVFLFTSLRDSTGAVVLEAMAKSMPIVTLNHQGMRLMVPDDAGIKVPVINPNQVASDLARAIDRLADSPEDRQAMAAGALRCAQANTWVHRAAQITAMYSAALGKAN